MKIPVSVDGSACTKRALGDLTAHGEMFVNLVFGSIATKVLAHCRTPVLLIR